MTEVASFTPIQIVESSGQTVITPDSADTQQALSDTSPSFSGASEKTIVFEAPKRKPKISSADQNPMQYADRVFHATHPSIPKPSDDFSFDSIPPLKL